MDAALIHLISIYGTIKWCEIARQMNNVYGFNRGPDKCRNRWQVIDPKRNGFNWGKDELFTVWKLFVEHEENYNMIKSIHPSRTKSDIGVKMFALMRRLLRYIDKLLNMERAFRFVYLIKMKVFLYIIKLNKHSVIKDCQDDDEESYSSIVLSSKRFVNIITTLCDQETRGANEQEMFKALAQHINKQEYLLLLDHIYHLKVMHDIYFRYFDPNKNEKQKQEESHNSKPGELTKFKTKLSKEVTNWDDAPDVPQSLVQVQVEKKIDQVEFRRYGIEDVDQIKRSKIYKILFPNQTLKFFQMFNESLVPQQNKNNQLEIDQLKEKYEQSSEIKNPKSRKNTKANNSKKQMKSEAKVEIKIVKKVKKSIRRSKATYRQAWTKYRDEDFVNELDNFMLEETPKDSSFKDGKQAKKEVMYKQERNDHTNLRLLNNQKAQDTVNKLALELFDI